MEQSNISQLDTVTLKALAYDQITQIEIAQSNLRIINQELLRRHNQPQEIVPVPQKPIIEPIPAGSIQRV